MWKHPHTRVNIISLASKASCYGSTSRGNKQRPGGLLIVRIRYEEINSCKAPLIQTSLFSGLNRFLNVFILLNDYSQMPRGDQFQEPMQITEFKDILFSYINTIFAYKPKHFLSYNLNYLQQLMQCKCYVNCCWRDGEMETQYSVHTCFPFEYFQSIIGGLYDMKTQIQRANDTSIISVYISTQKALLRSILILSNRVTFQKRPFVRT